MGTVQVQPVAVVQLPPLALTHELAGQHGCVGEHC
jgi:hypothetical protein